MEKLVYIGSVGWANSATAVHVQNRARLMQKLQIDTYAISDYPGEKSKIADIPELKYFYMTPYKGNKKIRGLKWNLDQFVCIFSYGQITKMLKELQPNIVVLYEVNSIMLELFLWKYCKKNKIKFVIETTEWMEPEKYKNLLTRLIVQQKHMQKKYVDKKCENIIAISNFLEEHYKSQKCNVIRIPPLFSGFDNEFMPTRYKDTRCNASINLVFAGTLSQKDFLEPMLKAVVNINSKEIKVSFDVIGPDLSEIQEVLSIYDLKSVGIYCHGILPHDEVLKYVKKADFSILLRQNMRYAKAGVSTKFVEAMCLGVPSICTKVGGTDTFVQDGVNGFIIEANSESAIVKILNYILKMSDNEILLMKSNAYKFAKQNFSIDIYIDTLKQFFEKCI